ncbi:amino acid permease [Haloferax mediterranei ATCC 33500]|uniref:Amino acid permease n=1 Tax=Haloferax mediterranei (strain ATCC 33500 / DSM 1411 / JCM 8866 / NBRC 14739 / NCIMB 2177 / R-4) TaxID=523841 RepID=I3R0Q2_HALMT|nr:amino acid permease [Haloferax mediterranei]AFK17812.1 putative cationic amino acid transport protein [Haloferax mediterranei ATCC 33500]AHZ22762.1 amino acid transporter [Haloferax mediterranei ATCC 33500]EMA02916.1 putative cationic amino acid transport protein [Haloferax mediterranei ATCC 33500]MDX5987901.1 amino acid permease [Haloferax mediterranei ATCC 33500]QCQ74375.1 amino acid permease [Haloferax mediterranei ATCC 33500]
MSETEQELARDLGFLEAYTIGLGTMIGAGIFVLPSIAAEQAGPASMISFFAGGLVSLLAALSLSELATGMPKAGGSYYYVNRALGPFFGSIVGWGMWAGLTFASAFYMIGFGQYLLPGLGKYVGFLAGWGQIGITVAALVMAAILTGVNYYGVKETGSLQNVIVLTLVGLIVAFLSLGIISGPTIQEFNPNGWPAVAATIGTVYVTFIGFEVIATSAEEIKNPSRNLPLAMIASVVTPTLMYVGVMFVSTGTLSIDVLTASPIPVADVATEFMGSIGALAMIVGAVLATVSSANASILSAARVNFAMGRDRILVNWLNEVHERFRTPYRAITATGIITLVLIAIGVGIGTLAEVASFMYLVTYALVHVTVVVLRRANPETYDPAFQIPSALYPIVPVVGMVACLAVLVQMSVEFVPTIVAVGSVDLVLPVTPTPVGAIGTVLIAFGVVWYYLYARERALSESLVGEAIAPEPATMADGEGRYRVVVPVANPETERDLLRMAAASAHAHEDEHAEVIAVNVIEVPRQTSLSQDLTFEEERVERQQELLDSARDIASDLEIGLRTRAIVGRDTGSIILDVIEEENVDHVLLGWKGTRSRREHVLGSTIDPVVGRAPCDATLVKLGPEDGRGKGDIMVLAGKGPHAPVAARRAAELVAAAADDASLTVLNVQSPEPDSDEDVSPTERGEAVIDELAERAGIEYMSYDSKVTVAEDTEQAILEAATGYDTICIGATRSGAISQAVFGSLPEKVGAEVEQTVVMARGPEESPMSIREALLRRLEV